MTDWVVRKFATMLMNQCWPNRARVSSSASWKHSGRRDAVKLTARLQNTLYYQTILGPDPIMDFDSLRSEIDLRVARAA